MRPSQDCYERLAQVDNLSGLFAELTLQIRTRLSLAAINLATITPTLRGSLASAVYARDELPRDAQQIVAQGVRLLHATPGFPDLFQQPGHMLRVEDHFGWDDWLRSPIYQEFFRPSYATRQLVVGLTSPSGIPRAFMAATRTEAEERFTPDDVSFILGLRDLAERAIKAFELEGDWSRSTDDILDSITALLPVPAVLVSATGQILWMNDEAQLRFGGSSLQFRSMNYFMSGGAIEELVQLARREIASPGTALDQRVLRSLKFVLAGESVVIRRLVQPGGNTRALVCLWSSATSSMKASVLPRLTARESEVACLAAEGYSAPNIAARLNTAESTVRSQLKSVYRKLGVCSRVELVRRIAG